MDILALLFYFLIIVPSSILHEYAHGAMAEYLGDSTARYAGRLTLDPRAHIDPIGTIAMPLFLFVATGGRFVFAYAKPVPYNPYNLRDQKWGPALVGIAGPLANFALAAMFAVVVRLFPSTTAAPFLAQVVYANLMLMVFNLVPLPPLDGSKVLYALLPAQAEGIKHFLDRYGTWLVIIFILFLFNLLSPIIDGLFRLLIGV